MRYFVVAPVLEYLRPCGRVLTVYFAPSRADSIFGPKCFLGLKTLVYLPLFF